MVPMGLRTSLLGAVPSDAALGPRLGRGSVGTASGSPCPLVPRMVAVGPAPGLVLGGAGENGSLFPQQQGADRVSERAA